MSLIKNIVNVDSQPELYALIKDVQVTDHGERESVPYFIARYFDSDYKQGVDSNLASDGRAHDFGHGKWSLAGDNQPCSLRQAIDMALHAVLYELLVQVRTRMQKYYTVIQLGSGAQRVAYHGVSEKKAHTVANNTLNQIAQYLYSTQNDRISGLFNDELSDYGIEERETILNDSDEFNQFSKSEQDYIKNSGYDYFVVEETVKPSHFIAPDDVSAIAYNLSVDLLHVGDSDDDLKI